MTGPSFTGLRVLALESRRATEVGALITTYGGVPMVAPALQEAPLNSNAAAMAFGRALMRSELDIIIFLTGVGTRTLLNTVAGEHGLEAVTRALAATRVVARGPKPLAVLHELGVPIWATAPEPNTWREILAALDAAVGGSDVTGARIAVQEYGASNAALLDGLRDRGAQVTAVPVYRWALPKDVEPLTRAVHALVQGEIDVVLLTTGVQSDHLWQMARTLNLEAALLPALERVVVASVGPSTSAALRGHGVTPDLEPSRPKMGFLVREAAEHAAALLGGKRRVSE
jgi:uroporphyrinogen-III synthase